MTQTHSILKIDASARKDGSFSRQLSDAFTTALADTSPDATITVRDLADTPPPFVTEDWVNANFTPEEQRTDTHRATLAASDALVDELKAADTIVIGTPIYNFNIPAALKAWVDMIARARLTFRYTQNGPEGLLTGKKAIILVASGGTAIGSDMDFATPYLKHILGFIGITDVDIIAADTLMQNESNFKDALTAIASRF